MMLNMSTIFQILFPISE